MDAAGRSAFRASFHDVQAVTFDFFNTLVHHHAGPGRGAAVMAYLHRLGLDSDPWEHQILYDIFESHGREYSPAFSAAQKRQYRIRLTERLFQRLRVAAGAADLAADHAADIWELIGPSSLAVYPDVRSTLEHLRGAGYRLAVISNWQCGLAHFCEELGMAGFFDAVVGSADTGWAKPAPEIFHEACRRLGVSPARTVHVGDTPADDIEGAAAAGVRAVLVCREAQTWTGTVARIRALAELPALLGLDGRKRLPGSVTV